MGSSDSSKTADLIASLSQDSKVNSKPWPLWKAFLAWLALAGLCFSLGISVLGIRSDLLAQLQTWSFLMEVLPFAVISLGSAWMVLNLRNPGSKWGSWGFQSMLFLLTLSVGFLVLSFCWECVINASSALSVFWAAGFKCMSGIVLVSLAPSLLLFYLARQGAPTELGKVATLCALSGAALGGLTINLYCSIDQALHHLLWTLVPVLGLASIGLLAGRKWLRW